MSAGRSQPLVHGGRGNLTPQGVARLNAAMRRATVFGGNATCPITSGPAGTVMQARTRVNYRKRGFPYGSDLFMWGVDITSDGEYLYIGGGLFHNWFSGGTFCDAATVGPFTTLSCAAENSGSSFEYVAVTLSAALTPVISTTPQTTADDTWRLYTSNYTDYPIRVPLYRVYTVNKDGHYLIDRVVPWHVGPIYAHLPNAVIGDDLKKLTWQHPVNTDWT
jgi:hypothetical protein